MSKRRNHDAEKHAQFVTFSCYHRRRLLDHPQAKQIVTKRLAHEISARAGTCVGYVVMPDHVHAIVWFEAANQLSTFMKQWKQRSSVEIKDLFRAKLTHYEATIATEDPAWQRKYYAFNIYTSEKLREKLTYIHANPVRAGLVRRAIDWQWSSARYYELLEPGDVPVRWID